MTKPYGYMDHEEGLRELLSRGYVHDPDHDRYVHPDKTSATHPKTYQVAAEHFLPRSEAERFGLVDYVIGLVDFEHSFASPSPPPKDR